jgi:signal transduction histidine kinase
MKKTRRGVSAAFYIRAILGVIFVLGASWTAARWALDFFFDGPSYSGSWLRGVTELLAALFLSTGFATVLGKILGRTHRHDGFTRLIEAMGRIARGDFSTNVELSDPQHEGPFDEVADSLNRMAEALARIEAMRQEFISDVSHEIQSPLTSIGGFARALRSPSITEEQRLHYLDIIEGESNRLSRIAADLLRLSALESNAQKLETETFRLDFQLREAILSCEPQWRDKRIDVGASCDEVLLTADPSLLRQVWTNLLHNAIKFTPSGGSIEVSARKTDNAAVVEVRDSGIGIEGENLPRAFDRFYKIDKARSAQAGGSGLGLAIAKKIVELHGGHIEARSDGVGRGTTFAVELPLDVAAEVV